jgi:hypothetical protein
VFREPHAQVKVAGLAATAARFAPPRQSQSLPLAHSWRNLDLIGIGLRRAPGAAADIDGAHGPTQCFGEADQNVSFDVLSALREILLLVTPLRAEASAASPPRLSEQLLEEIAEAGAAEIEFEVLARWSTSAKTAPAAELLPARWGPKLRAGLPVRAQFVVLLALGRVTKDFVSLVDFFEFLFSPLLVFGHVRVVFASQLAKCFLDVRLRRAPRHAERFVVIFELNGHN